MIRTTINVVAEFYNPFPAEGEAMVITFERFRGTEKMVIKWLKAVSKKQLYQDFRIEFVHVARLKDLK